MVKSFFHRSRLEHIDDIVDSR